MGILSSNARLNRILLSPPDDLQEITEETAFNVSSSALLALIEARRRYCAMNSYDTKSTIQVPGRVTLNE